MEIDLETISIIISGTLAVSGVIWANYNEHKKIINSLDKLVEDCRQSSKECREDIKQSRIDHQKEMKELFDEYRNDLKELLKH